MPGYPEIERLVNAFNIVDIVVHDAASDPDDIEWSDISIFESFTIVATSTFGQACTVRMFGNYFQDTTDPVQFLGTIAVPANSTRARTYDRAADGWFPHVYPQIQAAVAPAAGEGITIRIIKSKRMETWE